MFTFRNHSLSRWLHLGPVQPQEEQTAAHRQPQQEDDPLRRMVSVEKYFSCEIFSVD